MIVPVCRNRFVVTVPTPTGGTPPSSPTGIIFNGTTNFGASRFIFATEDGTISGWTNGANAQLKVDNSASGAIYKGLAVGVASGKSYLYAADFHNAKIDVFDTGYNSVISPGGFVDANLPAGFAPFNVQNIGGRLYVTYAKQDAAGEDDVPGPGIGYVDIFDTDGNFISRFASSGVLNSPWGLAIAPTGLGPFAGNCIGNFGDGPNQRL